MNEQVQKLMSLLDITEEQALQLIEDDKRIDRGEKLFEQTAEQKAASKVYRQADREKKPILLDSKPRARKVDEDKRYLMQLLEDAVCGIAEDLVEVTNPERELLFHYNGKKYKITLSAPRS